MQHNLLPTFEMADSILNVKCECLNVECSLSKIALLNISKSTLVDATKLKINNTESKKKKKTGSGRIFD